MATTKLHFHLTRAVGIELTTTAYATEEARRNLEIESARNWLTVLLARVRIAPESAEEPLPPEVAIAEKDKPVLRSAIAAGATHLLTGGLRDSGRFFGKRIREVQTPPLVCAGRSSGLAGSCHDPRLALAEEETSFVRAVGASRKMRGPR